jgi:Lambda phage tail tube protein, TTP
MSNAFLPRGTQFQRSPDGTTYTTIGEAKKVALAIKGSFEDVSNMDMPDPFKQFIGGLIDPGSAKVEANFLNNDTVQNLLLGDLTSQTDLFWRVQLPSARGKFEFSGFVEELSPDFDVSKPAGQSVSVKITGKPVWTPNV